MNLPEYIYHYTSIENLALILQSKKIRFNSITNVDDLSERITSDIGEIGSLLLVSCWTDKEEENISLWKMYSKDGTGVRIKMRPTLFHNTIKQKSDNFYSIDELSLFYPFNFLFKVEYKNSQIKTFKSNKNDGIDIVELGKIKDEI